jgi:oligoribonuclease
MKKKDNDGFLVWVDLEMTGLEIDTDVILEVASVITDSALQIIAEGPSYVVNQPEEFLSRMDSWCIEHHGKSGLIQAVRQSTITLEYAYEQTLSFVKQHCPEHTAILAGNSVYQDRIFLKKYMPKIVDYLHYRIIDVSTVKELVARWYSHNPLRVYKKTDTHRALSDVYESIAELQHYRASFFV